MEAKIHLLVTAPCKHDVPCTSACKPAACPELECSIQELHLTAYYGFPNTHICSSLHAGWGTCPHLCSALQGAAVKGQGNRWSHLYSEGQALP